MDQVLERTLALIQAPGARSKENEPCFDNAVSTLGKLIASYGDQLGDKAPALVEVWLQALPIKEDLEEVGPWHLLAHGISNVVGFWNGTSCGQC